MIEMQDFCLLVESEVEKMICGSCMRVLVLEEEDSYVMELSMPLEFKVRYKVAKDDTVLVKMTDPIEINEYLGRIESELKKYPNRFFKEIRDYGMQLTIYLVKDIPSSDIAGLTNSQAYSNKHQYSALAHDLRFSRTINLLL